MDNLKSLLAKVFKSNDNSLWAKWHKEHNLLAVSFWAVDEKQTDTWTWKMLLKLRQLAQRFIRREIGNGATTHFWYDSWTPLGCLITVAGPGGPCSLGVPLHATVAEVCDQNGWRLHHPRTDCALAIHSYLTSIPFPTHSDTHDTNKWYVEESNCNGYSAPKTWESIRPRNAEQPWFDVVWYKGAIPKQAFHMWVTNLNRLPTRQRLAAWGVSSSDSCCLCSCLPETRDHLMLRCSFVAIIWAQAFHRLCPTQNLFGSWSELLSWIRRSTTQAPSLIKKTVAHTVIYHTWRQRNNVLHNNQSIHPLTIFKIIDRDVKNIINSRRTRKHWKQLMASWIQ